MKLHFLPFLAFLFLTSTSFGQTYVKQDATGNNDGSSWADAYNDLAVALGSSSPNDQIWVAAGTYKPGSGTADIDTFFTFPHDLELYGGFAGTETMLSERDIMSNETVLSGDHNDDDVDGDFENNKTDNSKHVIWLTDTVTVASVIDGFTITKGNTEPGSGSGNARRGGGILTYGAPAIRNCTFTQNYGYFGGALYPRGGGATGTVIEDCTFEGNFGQFGSCLYFNGDTGTLTNSSFVGNTSVSLGGAVYNNAEGEGGITVTDCTFTDNESVESRGGAVYNTTSPSTYTNCTFTNNSATASSGGGLQVRHTDDELPGVEVVITDCTFTGNDARFGGAVGSYDALSTTTLVNCEFTGNSCVNVGGALSNAFGSTTNIDDCMFSENTSGISGGAVYSQNDSAFVNITNTTIMLNSAEERGGAISITGDNEPQSITPIPTLTIDRCVISFNLAADQAGGINISNANMSITNSIIDNNTTPIENGGIGGAMSLNTSDSIQANFNIINTTIAANTGLIGAGIANWTAGDDASSTLNLQNTILANLAGTDYEIEDGMPMAMSSGGNLSIDATMNDILTGTNDLTETNPLFVDYDQSDFHLADGSPCIDAGIEAGAPLIDLEGLPRVGPPDMGAYENQQIVSTRDVNQYFGKVEIFPNPVDDVLHFTFESTYNGSLEMVISSVDGKVIDREKAEKIEKIITQQFNVKTLPTGIYNLQISNGQLVRTERFVKE